MKQCTKCRQRKDKSEFSKNRKNKDGLRYWCKKCSREHKRRYYRKNRGTVKRYFRYEERHRTSIWAILWFPHRAQNPLMNVGVVGRQGVRILVTLYVLKTYPLSGVSTPTIPTKHIGFIKQHLHNVHVHPKNSVLLIPTGLTVTCVMRLILLSWQHECHKNPSNKPPPCACLRW